MAHCEIDSFVTKFKHLCHAGYKAMLTVESSDGEVSVTLRTGLGPIPSSSRPRHRGPAYQRRQERRQVARATAADQVSSPTVEVREHASNDDKSAAEADASEKVAVQKKLNSKTNEHDTDNAEQADAFHCPLCDFRSNWANGLEIHKTRKHQKIEQLDGNNSADEDLDEDEKYSNTKKYWENGKLGTIFQDFIDANYIIENSELQEQCKTIEKTKILEARKCSFGKDYKYYPPWR